MHLRMTSEKREEFNRMLKERRRGCTQRDFNSHSSSFCKKWNPVLCKHAAVGISSAAFRIGSTRRPRRGAVSCAAERIARRAEDVVRDLDDLLKIFDGLLAGEYQPLEGALRVYGPVRDGNASPVRSCCAATYTSRPPRWPPRSRRSRRHPPTGW
jgi:hypothetical protein